MSGKQLGADTSLRFLYTVLKQLDMKNVCHPVPVSACFLNPN